MDCRHYFRGAVLLAACASLCIARGEDTAAGPDTARVDTGATACQLDKMIVRDRRMHIDRRIAIDDREERLGLKDDINAFVAREPGVQQTPEAGSSLLIRGEGRYDYAYRIWNIPVLTASHFTNHVFADRSGMMIAAVDDVALTADALAGRYADVSAGVISVNPGFARESDPRWKRRPELAVNLGSLGADFSYSRPLRDSDMYQVSWRFINEYLIRALAGSYRSTDRDAPGDIPGSYQDIILNGRTRLGSARLHEYAWFAFDRYGIDRQSSRREPWGFGALTLTDASQPHTRSLTLGGSYQYVEEHARYAYLFPRKRIDQRNAVIDASLRDISLGAVRLDYGLFGEYRDWRGSVRSGVPAAIDSVNPNVLIERSAHEAHLYGRTGVRGAAGGLDYGINLLTGIFAPSMRGFVNPGLWLQTTTRNGWIGASAGIHSTRPDIRGLPDSSYRGVVIANAQASLRAGASIALPKDKAFELEAQTWVKHKDRAPAYSDNPARPVWDPARETSLLIAGAAGSASLDLSRRVSAYISATANYSRRIDSSGARRGYEWQIPWSTTGSLRIRFLKDYVTLYLLGALSPGVPYRNCIEVNGAPWFADTLERAPLYKRLDCTLQFSQPVDGHRYMTRFDLYVEMSNVVNFLLYHFSGYNSGWRNVRDYYWDYSFAKQPVYLDPWRVNIGTRIGIRF